MHDYLKWYWRTEDFSSVERRKQLVKTPKAIFLIASAYAIVFLFLALAYLVFWTTPIVSLTLIVLAPYMLAYAIICPVFLVKIVQKTFEQVLIERARRKLAKHQGIKIAIAGSFGKTSMREILKTILSEGKEVSAPPFSYNTPIGICRFINGLVGDEDILIFELGEYYAGDVRKLCTLIDPQIGIITGVNEAHLEKFGTLANTASTIFELAQYLKEKPTYVNGENELARNNASEKHIMYSSTGAGNCRVENPRTDLNGTSFTIIKGDTRIPVNSKLLGLHNIGPLMASAHIAYQLGLTDKQVQAGIGKTHAFDHRLLPSEDGSGIITIDDSYNGNPDGVHAIIDFLSSIKGHRRWYVTPGLVEMGSRTADVHVEIGRQLARAGIERIVLIKNSVTPHIEEGLKGAGYAGEILWFQDALQAYAALPHLTVKGDIVLLQNDWPDQYV
ncbi:MAG: UDP-N-acetylmuramoyl-tripeptide--D-alanyl-D-alanine ligase [bacterium]|nr:UDP-N-acetylmuramoyl-tripeptide--D-alanyl-D-alanine ligase [bacterium]